MTQDEIVKLVLGNQLPRYEIRDAEADGGAVFVDLERGMFLLLKSNVRLNDRGKAWIARLKEANEDVCTAYLPKEQVIAFYEQKSRGEAEDYLKKWASACIAEGINNKIKVIKRMAFGFHDFEHFRLKILSVTGYLRSYPRVLAS